MGPSDQPIGVQFGTRHVRDYGLHYTLLTFNLQNEMPTVFPRIGYLVCNLFIGEQLTCRFLNHSRETLYSNRLYITGLFSKHSLAFACGKLGKGYAIKIHPVIGYHLLKIPMTEVTSRPVMVSDALEIRGEALRTLENNDEITSIDDERFRQFLWEALPDKRAFLQDPIYHAVNALMACQGNMQIRKLAADHFMTERTLRRQFLQKVGLPPQAYARILKVENAVNWIRNHPTMSLEEVAYRAGFYDVAHLAHDFTSNVNVSPSSFRENLNPLVKNYLDNPSMDV